jgi:hypothetical protein
MYAFFGGYPSVQSMIDPREALRCPKKNCAGMIMGSMTAARTLAATSCCSACQQSPSTAELAKLSAALADITAVTANALPNPTYTGRMLSDMLKNVAHLAARVLIMH